MKITIEWIDGGGDPIVLMDETTRLRETAYAEDRRSEADRLKTGRMPELAAHANMEADAAERRIKIDDDLRTECADAVRTSVFEFDEPTIGDQMDVRKASGDDPARAIAASYERMKPRAVEGWTGSIPIAFAQILSMECYRAVFPDLSEDRRFFWIRSRAARRVSGHGSSSAK